MKDQADIINAARFFVARFGDHALREAMRRADELDRLGDREGRDLWSLIAATARELEPQPGDRAPTRRGNRA